MVILFFSLDVSAMCAAALILLVSLCVFTESAVNWLAVGRYKAPDDHSWALSTSSDGISWSPSLSANGVGKRFLNPYIVVPHSPVLAFGERGVNGRWVLGGYPAAGVTSCIFYSDNNGQSFVAASGADGPLFPRALAFSGSLWLALLRAPGAVSQMFLYNSSDASSWANHSQANLPMEDLQQSVDLKYVSAKRLWYAMTGRGVFQSSDTFNWTFVNTTFDSLTQTLVPFPTPNGAPVGLAVSPFGEYWMAIGPYAEGFNGNFVFSNTGASFEWFPQQELKLFGSIDDNSQARGIAYGGGQFVVVGFAENRTYANVSSANTIFVATNTSLVVGMGNAWFDYALDPRNRLANSVKYSEIQSRFVLCGAFGDANSSIIYSFQALQNDFKRTDAPFTRDCRAIATREDIPDFQVGGSFSGSFGRTRIISVPVTVDSVTIDHGDLKVESFIRFPSTSNLNVSGSLYLSNLTRIALGSQVYAQAAIVAFPDSSVLEVEIASVPENATSLLVPLFNYSFRVGSFRSIRAIYSGNDCSVVLGVPEISYGSSSASALVSVGQVSCTPMPGFPESSSLSTGAIVGIAIGAACIGVIAVVGLIFLMKHLLHRRDFHVNQQLKEREMANLRAVRAVHH